MRHRNAHFPNRIISLEPSVTATLLALDRGDRLIAVSEHDERLLGAQIPKHLPRVPCTWSVKAEDILPLEPDIVVASVPLRRESWQDLVMAGIDILLLHPQHLDSIYRNIRLLAALTDAREQGEKIIASMENTFAHLWEHSNEHPSFRIYVEVWPRPLMNGAAWHGDIVSLLGGEFVPHGFNRVVESEEIIAADPDVILVIWPGVEQPPLEKIYQRPGWEQITAVQKGRVISIPEIWINAPGPNLAQGAEMLADVLRKVL